MWEPRDDLMRIARLLFLFCIGCGLAQAQNPSATKTITATGQCVSVRASNNSTVGIVLSGTWTGTLTPTLQIDASSGAPKAATNVTPTGSTTAQSTITANGGYTSNVAGFTQFNLCSTGIWTSGSATATLNPSQAVTASSGGGGSGSVTAVTATSPIAVATGTTTPALTFAASILNPAYGGDGGGTNDNSTAMTAACAANSEVWLPGNADGSLATYNFTGSLPYTYSFPCPLHFGANARLGFPQGVKGSNLVVASAPPNVQLVTLGAGLTASDNMTRANENPMSDGGNWTVGSFAGITGSTSEAGQIVSDFYEPVTVSSAVFGYVLWTGSGVFPPDQCSEVTTKTATGAPTFNMAVVRGSTTDGLFYRIQTYGLGATAGVSLVYQNHTTQTALAAASPNFPIF